MRKVLVFLLAAASLFLSEMAGAQLKPVKLEDDYDFRGRVSAEVEKKIVHGLSASVSEEIRLRDNFTELDRFMTTVSLSYKPIQYFKIGLGWSMINSTKNPEIDSSMNIEDNEDGSDSKYEWRMRHRFFFDATGLYKVGILRLSLRERVLATVRPGEFNEFQNPRHEIALQTRAKVGLSFPHFQPYVLADVKALLNQVDPESLAISKSEIGTKEVKYNSAYVSRIRSSIGLEYKVNKRNSLDFYVLGDYCMDRDIDTNAEGKIKTVTVQLPDGSIEKRNAVYFQNSFNTSLGVAYKYSF